MNRFYAIIPIGLEDLALKELSKVSLDLQLEFGEQGLLQDIQMEMGGIEFDFDFHLGILLNTILKIPSRLLLRWHKFEAKEFPTLFKKLNNLPWESSVFKDGIGEIEVAASKSKLNNEKRILKVLKEEVLVQKKIAIGIKNAPNLYLRMYNDQLQLSIDTTGEHLHFRGYRNTQGVAPLRENFAASLWYFTTQDLGLIDLKNLKIVDPLCGSGTLLFESFLFEKILNFQRDFPLLKLVPQKIFDRFKTALSSSQGVSHFNSFFGFDSLENIVQVAKTNLSLITEKYPEGKNISFVQQDLFSKDKAPFKSDIVLSNPPYGERLKLKDGYSLPNYIEAILTEYEPQIAGFVLPAKSEILNLNQILNYKKENQIQFLNNGIRVVMQKYVRSKS